MWSEDSTFQGTRKTQYEEYIYRLEVRGVVGGGERDESEVFGRQCKRGIIDIWEEIRRVDVNV